jgi:prolyl oligopeptidase
MSNVDPRPTVEAPDDDPYLWLEDIEGARALQWVAQQNAATLQRFADARFAADRDVLKAIFDRPENIPYIARAGARVLNFWRDAAHSRGLWRMTSLQSFRTESPDWQVLLDMDALAAKEGEDWVFAGAAVCPRTHHRAIIRLSRGGGDAVELREFDLEARDFVPGGFALSEALSFTDWLDPDTLLLASAAGPGMACRSGYARTIRLWQRGTEPTACPVIFETREDSVGAFASADRAPDERIWFVDKTSLLESKVWLGDRSGPKTQLQVPGDASLQCHEDWLVVKPRTAWTVDGVTLAPDTIVATSLQAFLAGDRHFTRLFEPVGRRVLQGFFWCGGRLVLSILDDLKPVFETLTPSERGWSRRGIAGLPDQGTIHVWPLDSIAEESNGDLLGITQDPLTPPSLFLIAPMAAPQLLKRLPEAFDRDDLVITRHEAVSSDGTRVPYTQVGRPAKTGDAPVHLYGYGGFGISVLPTYNAAIGKLWLERGGISVIAHLRGGRELGVAWYEAARREGRRLAHDDFAAVAADLVERGVTRPHRIAAEGGSNGGLLIANMLTRYPQRFGALFCTLPLIDMRRYTRLLSGPWHIDEYGDPDKPEDWKFLAGLSAYHVAAPGQPYPPILIATTRRDDRVHPGHARKMAAKLQTLGYEAYYYELAAGGHSYGKDHGEQAAFLALGYNFLRREIGWEA